MPKTQAMSITTARMNFTKMGEIFEKQQDVVQITRYGQPYMAVMSWEEYESLLETREILGDPETINHLIKALKQLMDGRKGMTETKIRKKLGL